MTVGIVGLGVVGGAVYQALAKAHIWAKVYDTNPAMELKTNKEKMATCDLVFVCVPTPPKEDGSCDTSIVEEVLDWVTGRWNMPLVVIRSTMPTNFTRGVGVLYQPEFIGESAFAPFKNEGSAGLVLVGGEPYDAQKVLNFWKPILGPKCRYLKCSWKTAAQVKYVANCYQAVKTALWHEMLEACEEPDFVRDACLTIPTIEPYGTLPLGGVGGRCFPKDLAAFAREVDGPILKAALQYIPKA